MDLPANHVSYYTVLGVESKSTTQEIKIAYRKLLLQHHPDKSLSNQNISEESQSPDTSKSINISQIKDAYNTLISSRSEYDDALHEFQIKRGLVDIDGIDHFDLDEFTIASDPDNDEEVFLLDCPRCTASQGFKLNETDLENAVQPNIEVQNLLIQCKDCSLWICVNYSIN